MSKKLGSYHSKSHFLDLRKSLFEPSFSLERDFEGLKNNFLSYKSPIFLTFSTHKGSISTRGKTIFESENFKWSKMSLKVGRFGGRTAIVQHCVIRKFWKHESPEHCAQCALCNQLGAHWRGGRRSFLIRAVIVMKQKHLRPPPGVQRVGCTLLG